MGSLDAYTVPVALGAVALITGVVLAGIRRTNAANIVIVAVTVLSLLFFVVAGAPAIDPSNLTPFFGGSGARETVPALLESTALMFVAYTGYARIATLGEEVRDPERTIPRAIVVTILLVMLLYEAVALVGIGAAGSEALLAATEEQIAPLAAASRDLPPPWGAAVLSWAR